MTCRYEDKIRCIAEETLGRSEIRDMSVDEKFETVGMDSLSCMEFIVALEDAFAFEMPDELLDQQAVGSIREVSRLLEELLKDTAEEKRDREEIPPIAPTDAPEIQKGKGE